MRYIFGHRSSNHPGEFSSSDQGLNFLHYELPEQHAFRYRSTHRYRNIDSILFSFEGKLLAELVVAEVQSPLPEDIAVYGKAKTVYIIDEIRYFANPSLSASDFGLSNYQFGKQVSDEIYTQIVARAGGFSGTRKRHS